MIDPASDDRQSRASWLANAGWLTAANVLSFGISAAVGLALVRVLGPSDLGRYSLATVTSAMLSAVVGFRLDQHLLTRLHRHHQDDLSAVASAVRASYAIYAVVAGVGVLGAVVGLRGVVRALGLLVLLEVGVTPLLLTRVVLQVSMRQKAALRCTAGARATWLLGVGVLLVLHAASVPAVIAMRIGSMLVEVSLLARATGFGPRRLWMAERTHGDAMVELRSSAPLAWSGLAGELHGRIDQPLLAVFATARELGVYAAAVRVADLAGMLAPITQTVVTPALIDSARKDDRDAFERTLRDGLVLTLIPAAWIISMTVAQSDWIIRVVAGHGYEPAGPLLVILAFAEWATFVGGAYASALLAVGERRVLAVASIAGLTVNFAGNLAFMPAFGATAAAWTTLAGCLVSAIVSMFLTARIREALAATGGVVAVSAVSVIAASVVGRVVNASVAVSLLLATSVYCAPHALFLRPEIARASQFVRSRTRATARRSA